jgi:hypothetical protein
MRPAPVGVCRRSDRECTVGRQVSNGDDRHAGDQKVEIVSGDRAPDAVTMRNLPRKGTQRRLVAAITAVTIKQRGELRDGMPRDVVERAVALAAAVRSCRDECMEAAPGQRWLHGSGV